MSISITGSFRIDIGSNKLNVMDETKWVEVKVGEVNRRHEEKLIKDQKLIVESDIKRTHAPEFWSRTRALIKSRTDAFCKEFGQNVLTFEVCVVNQAVVRLRNTSTTIDASFDPKTLRILCRLPNTTLQYDPLVENGKLLYAEYQGSHCSEEQISEKFLNSIVDLV